MKIFWFLAVRRGYWFPIEKAREINSFFFSLFPFHRLQQWQQQLAIKHQGMVTFQLICEILISLNEKCPLEHIHIQLNATSTTKEAVDERILITFSIIYKSPSHTFSILDFFAIAAAFFCVAACHFIAFIKNSFFMFFYAFHQTTADVSTDAAVAVLMRIYSEMFTLNCFKSIAFEGSQHARIFRT